MEITRREFRRLLYGDHPYGRDPLGTPETLGRFNREDLVAWHSRWYRPIRTVFAVSGDFERAWMLEQIRGLFGDPPGGSGEFTYPEVFHQANDGRRFFIEKDLNQSTVRIGHLGIRKDNPDALPLEILNYIIGGGGFTSRLVNKVRTESGFAYLVGSVFDEPLLTGQFLAVLQTQTKNAVNAMRLTMEVIRDAVENENITQEELVQAKESKLNEFVFKFETPYDVVRQYAELEYYSLPLDYLETYRDRLAAITHEDLARVGKKYIDTSAMTVLVLGHKDARPGLEELGEVEDIQLEESP
jgi:predicted Zn-dependent peptidase